MSEFILLAESNGITFKNSDLKIDGDVEILCASGAKIRHQRIGISWIALLSKAFGMQPTKMIVASCYTSEFFRVCRSSDWPPQILKGIKWHPIKRWKNYCSWSNCVGEKQMYYCSSWSVVEGAMLIGKRRTLNTTQKHALRIATKVDTSS